MPHIKSLFRSLPSSTPTINYYDWLLGRPELKSWPDFALHIDGVTGERRHFNATLERFEQAATALSASPSDGGPGLAARQGEIVGILSENCLEFPVLTFALLKIAVPLALLHAHATFHETVALLKLSSVTCLFVSERLYPHASAAAKEIGLPEEKIFILQGEVKGKLSLPRLINNVKARGLPSVPTQTVGDDTLAYLMFSSGTTGLPKAVMTSHRNMMFSTWQLLPIGEEIAKVFTPVSKKISVHLAILPWYHTMGFLNHVLRPLISPTTLIVLPYWNIDLVVKAFSKYRITHFLMVPSMMQQILHNPRLVKLDLRSLVSAGAGAGYVPPDLRLAFQRRATNVSFFGEGYGMSECASTVLILPVPGMFGGRVDPIRGMTGILSPNFEGRILREDGSDADYDEIGEFIVRGPSNALGYWNNESATKDAFKDGWLYTGDHFYVDRQDRFFYVDRAKDVLKVSGRQVSPTEVENVIREHPSQFVTDVAVAGVKGERLSGEHVPRAWIVLSDAGKEQGVEAVLAILDKWVRSRLSKHKWLRGGFQVVDEIPKLPTGKILRRQLQDEYARSERGHAETRLLTKL